MPNIFNDFIIHCGICNPLSEPLMNFSKRFPKCFKANKKKCKYIRLAMEILFIVLSYLFL